MKEKTHIIILVALLLILPSCNKNNNNTTDHLLRSQPNPYLYQQYIEKGRSAGKRKNYDRAILFFLQAYSIKPKHMMTLLSLGECYVQTGNLQEAHFYFSEALKIDINNNIAQMKLGEIYYKMEDFSNAIYHTERAIKLKLNDYKSTGNLALMYFKTNNYQLSKQYIQRFKYIITKINLNLLSAEDRYKLGRQISEIQSCQATINNLSLNQ